MKETFAGKRCILCHCVAWIFSSLVATSGRADTLNTPDITITGLTHTFGHFAPAGPTTSISDSAAAGQFIQTGFNATLTGSELVDSHFIASPGQKFVVHAPPAGFGNVSLKVIGSWSAGSDGTPSPVTNTFTFDNLNGPTPVLTSSLNALGAGGKWVQSYAVFTVAPGTEFTGVHIIAQFASTIANPTNRAFTPLSMTFNAMVSSTQSLSDGILLTMEPVPRPPISQSSETPFALSWPTNFNSWVLESTTNMGGPWSAVTNVPVILGTNIVYTNTDAGPVRYYRLKLP